MARERKQARQKVQAARQRVGGYRSSITGKTYQTAGARTGAEKRQIAYERKSGKIKGAYGSGGRMEYRSAEELLNLRWYYDNLPGALKSDANRHHSSSWIIVNGIMMAPGKSGRQLFTSGIDGGNVSNEEALEMIYGARQADLLREWIANGGEMPEEDDEDEESEY